MLSREPYFQLEMPVQHTCCTSRVLGQTPQGVSQKLCELAASKAGVREFCERLPDDEVRALMPTSARRKRVYAGTRDRDFA